MSPCSAPPSGGQAPLIADGEGSFTKAFIDSIKDKGADANHNGVVSNAEILAFIREKSKTACADASACPLGADADARSRRRPSAARRSRGGEPSGGKLTADQILDFFAKGNTHGVALEMMPPSPVKVGTQATSASASPARRRAISSSSISATTAR